MTDEVLSANFLKFKQDFLKADNRWFFIISLLLFRHYPNKEIT